MTYPITGKDTPHIMTKTLLALSLAAAILAPTPARAADVAGSATTHAPVKRVAVREQQTRRIPGEWNTRVERRHRVLVLVGVADIEHSPWSRWRLVKTCASTCIPAP